MIDLGDAKALRLAHWAANEFTSAGSALHCFDNKPNEIP